MFKGLLVSALVLMGLSANADQPTLIESLVGMQQEAARSEASGEMGIYGLNWKVGDTNTYDLNVGGFINGSMVMAVARYTAEGFWVTQDLDLGFAGKQNAEILFDKNTGQVLKMIVGGKEQALPDPNDLELIDMKEAKVTVPAGTFDCIHIRARNKKENNEINQWANPQLIPISGMLKSIAPSQLGEVNIALKSFRKN